MPCTHCIDSYNPNLSRYPTTP